MNISLECFKQFQKEGCMPDLILLSDNTYLSDDDSVTCWANNILEKIILEGKDNALLYAISYSLYLDY